MSSKKYTQRSLTHLFKKKKDIEPTQNYFHLSLRDVGFFTYKQQDSVVLHQIKWEFKGCLLNISISEKLLEDLQQNKDTPLSTCDKGTSAMLKSHLQKNIRRRQTESALATADLMMDLDLVAFLRRLPIIVIEDVCLIKEYGYLVWLMCYHSEYKHPISDSWRHFIKRVIVGLCERGYKDPYPDRKKFGGDFTKKTLEEYNMWSHHVDLLLALQLRKSYGGMSCDGKMIDRYSHKWLRCFVDGNTKMLFELNKDLPDAPKESIRLTSDNFELAGIDFHCCPDMINVIKKKHEAIYRSSELLRETIWHCSSGINIREEIEVDEKYRICWSSIKKDVRQYARKRRDQLLDTI